MRRPLTAALVSWVLLATFAAQPATAEFPLKDGDIWVMAGDSITAQHLHSNYFEAFCFARYPQLKFAFRNSGVGGHTIPSTLARFDYDVAAWKPTVISVELGMNDQGGTPTEKFVENMKAMIERIRGVSARPVILSASPINNGDTLAHLGGNQRLSDYATALKNLCSSEQIPYADQFHALVDAWGKNKSREVLANSTGALKQLAEDDSLSGVEHLRAFLAALDQSERKPVSLQGDPVHPGPPGQLLMAAALLKLLGADGFVSAAELDASGKVAQAKGCTIDEVRAADGALAFDRLDERLPLPISDDARAAMTLLPDVLELSQYTLKVTGLKPAKYELKIDGVPVATLGEAELAAGINLTALGPGPQPNQVNPIVAQSRAILNAVAGKEHLVGQWRANSQKAYAAGAAPELKDQLAAQLPTVEQADEKIRAAAQPQKHRFELNRLP